MKSIYTLLTLLALSSFARAQPGQPGDPNTAPLDGGISILFASGAALGAAKYRQMKKEGKV